MASQTVPLVVRRTDTDQLPARNRIAGLLRGYVALTKPRIIELLLVTTVPPMMLAAHGMPSLALIGATLVGGTLAAGCANTINCYLDRDIDTVMRRTRRRPLATSTEAGTGTAPISPGRALAFGLALGLAGTALLGLAANWLAAGLADAAIVYYIVVYTLILKRHTPSNIVIGGAAGSFPVLVGWAAVTGRLGVPAILLALLVFMWTPPHFWALAVKFRADYAAAGVPMLPVVASPATVGSKILKYAYLTVGVSLTLIPFAGPLYGIAAGVTGAWFLVEAHRLRTALRAGARSRPMALFRASITYLTMLFAALAVGALL